MQPEDLLALILLGALVYTTGTIAVLAFFAWLFWRMKAVVDKGVKDREKRAVTHLAPVPVSRAMTGAGGWGS